MKLEQEFEREPSAEELSEILDMSAEEIEVSILSKVKHISMDAPLSADGEDDRSLYDVLGEKSDRVKPEDALLKKSLIQEVERALVSLTSREAEIVSLYYGIKQNKTRTLEEIGKRYGLTRERVRQIKERALNKLKTTSRGKLLRKYLG